MLSSLILASSIILNLGCNEFKDIAYIAKKEIGETLIELEDCEKVYSSKVCTIYGQELSAWLNTLVYSKEYLEKNCEKL